MASSLNKVQLIGNLTADPEVRETPNGQKVANFTIATSRKWKDQSGMMQEQSEFHNCVAWRGLADIAEQYMSKGKKVYLEWYLQTRSWDDTTSGQKRYKTDIVADNIILLGSPTGSSSASGSYNSPSNSSEFTPTGDTMPTRAKARVEEEINIEDIPF